MKSNLTAIRLMGLKETLGFMITNDGQRWYFDNGFLHVKNRCGISGMYMEK